MNSRLRRGLFVLLCVIQLGVCYFLIYRWEKVIKLGYSFKFYNRPVDPYDAFRGRFVALNLEQDSVDVQSADVFKKFQYGVSAYAKIATDSKGFAVLKELDTQLPPGTNNYLMVKVRTVDRMMNFSSPEILDALSIASKILHSQEKVPAGIQLKLLSYEKQEIEKALTTGKRTQVLGFTIMGVLNRLLTNTEFAKEMLGEQIAKNSLNDPTHVRKLLENTFSGALGILHGKRVFVELPFKRFYMNEYLAPQAELAVNVRQGQGENGTENLSERGDFDTEQRRSYITVKVLDGYGVIENLWIGNKTVSEFLKSKNK